MINYLKLINNECKRRAKYLDSVDGLYCALYQSINSMSNTEERMRKFGANMLGDIVWNIIVGDNQYLYQKRLVREIVINLHYWSGFDGKESLIRYFASRLIHLFNEECLDFGIMPPQSNINDIDINDMLTVVRIIVDGYMDDEYIDVIAEGIDWMFNREVFD